MESPELTILMPCLNEAETLANCIQKAKNFLAQEKIQGEILVADNGSTDGSQVIAKTHGARLISVPTRGYGAALRTGIKAASGRYIIIGDADDSYDFQNLMPFLNKLREGYDLVIGNRFKGGIVQGAMPFLNRYLGNPILSFIGRIFFGNHIGDFHCGLRGLSRDCFLHLNLQGNGMEFASEMIIKATLQKLNITEVPTQLFPDGRTRPSHLRPWRDGWRHLRLLLLLSPRWLFFYPGLGLLLLGTLFMALLIKGPIEIGQVNFDIHTMLFSSLLMIIGLQSIFFSVFTHVITYTQIPFRLEYGLIIGLILILFGGSGFCYSFWYWSSKAFGPLIPTHMMRLLIPSITSFILGIEIIFSSFFLSILHLHKN